MNMLGLIQTASMEMGLASPNYVAGNTSTDVLQLLALTNAVGAEMAREFPWQYLDTEYRFTTQYVTLTGVVTAGSPVVTGLSSTVGLDTTYMVIGLGAPIPVDTFIKSVDSSSQVTLNQSATSSGTIPLNFCKTQYSMPSDYDRIVDRTQWDKSKRWVMEGPLTAQQWQFIKSGYISTGPRIRWRILGNKFQTWPPIAANEYLGFEYISGAWATDISGARKSLFTVDTDTCFYPDRLMVLGIKLKYFEVKGFDTTALMRDFLTQKSIAHANDGGSQTLMMAPRMSEQLIGWSNIQDTGYGS